MAKSTSSSLSKRVESILRFLEDSVKDAKKLAIAEAPEVVQQVIRWEIWSNALTILFCSLFILAVAALQGSYVLTWDQPLNCGEGYFPASCSPIGPMFYMTCLLYIVPLIIVACAVHGIVKVRVAPKVFLLEYVKDFLTPESTD